MKLLYLLPFFLIHYNSFAQETQGQCQCAVFESKDGKVPIMSRSPGFNVTCDVTGQDACRRMCIALAQAARRAAPNILCEIVKIQTRKLHPAVFFKICDDSRWKYTGLTSTQDICCYDGIPTECLPY